MAAANGPPPFDIVWCESEHSMPPDRWERRPFRSAFTFDFEKEGRFLEALETETPDGAQISIIPAVAGG